MLKADIKLVYEIARQIIKEESGAIGKLLEATSKKLEMEIKNLEANSAKLKELTEDLGRQIRNLVIEQAELKRELRKPEKPAGKSFSKK